MKSVEVEDVHYAKAVAFVSLLTKQRELYIELRNLRRRGEPYSSKENKRMLRVVNDMEMCQANFSEIFAQGDLFKGIRVAQLRLLRLLEKQVKKKKK